MFRYAEHSLQKVRKSTVHCSENKINPGNYSNRCNCYFPHIDFNIDVSTWENAASDRPAWRSMIHKGALHSEAQRSNAAKEKRRARKARAENFTNTPHTLWCQTCGRGYHARIGLISHQRTHRWTILNVVWHCHIRNWIDEQQAREK